MEILAAIEENDQVVTRSFLYDLAIGTSYGYVNSSGVPLDLNTQVFLAQREAILEFSQAPCVIVGRGADYILRDFPNVVNVFVYAEEEDKVKYAMETFGESREQAIRRVHHSDAARESYYHYLTRGKWGNLSNYHLTLNSSPIGKEACADVIIAYAKKLQK